jgi:hypothetical protein
VGWGECQVLNIFESGLWEEGSYEEGGRSSCSTKEKKCWVLFCFRIILCELSCQGICTPLQQEGEAQGELERNLLLW